MAGLAVEAVLGEEVARNEPVFTKCERKPQSQLVQVGEYLNNIYKISTIVSTLKYPGRYLVQHGQPQPHHLPLPTHLHRAGRGLDIHQVSIYYLSKY